MKHPLVHAQRPRNLVDAGAPRWFIFSEVSGGKVTARPVLDRTKVYAFDSELPFPVPQYVVLIHQRGDLWSQELAGHLCLLPAKAVQGLLDSLWEEGVPLFAGDREEFFRRLQRLPSRLHHAARN